MVVLIASAEACKPGERRRIARPYHSDPPLLVVNVFFQPFLPKVMQRNELTPRKCYPDARTL